MLVDVMVWVIPPALGDVPDPSFIPHQCDARNVDECVEGPSPACFTELVKGGHSPSVSPNPPLHCPQLKPSLLCNSHTIRHAISLCVQYRRIISAGLWLLGFKAKPDSKGLKYVLLDQDSHLDVICQITSAKCIPIYWIVILPK